MSIVAGYVRKEGRFSDEIVKDKIKSFTCISNDKLDAYDHYVIRTKFGHIMMRYKSDYPLKYAPLNDFSGNTLAVLGFLRFTDSPKSLKDIFERCIAHSPKIIENCEGEFVAVFANGYTGELHIINDRFASRPCYIYKAQNGFYFSSSLSFLIGLVPDRPSQDIIGWLQVFGYGSTIGKRTTFDEIKRVGPASHISFSNEKLVDHQYHQHENTHTEPLNPETYVDEVFDCFKEGVKYRTELVGKGILALSGGLDSRLIAGCIPGKKIYAFTFLDSIADKNTIEATTASKVSSILRIKHHVGIIPKAYASSVAKDIILLTGGLRGLNHLVKIMMYIDYIKNNGFNYLLGGGPGDVIAGSFIPESLVCVNKECVNKGILLFYDNFTRHGAYIDSLDCIFRKEILKDYKTPLVKSFFKLFDKIKGETAAHRITTWAIMNRHPAFTFTTPIHNHPDVGETFCHINYKFCELMLKMPAEWLCGKIFYKYMIYKKLPMLRDVIYANTGEKLTDKLLQCQCVSTKRPASQIDNLKMIVKNNNVALKSYSEIKKFTKRFVCKNRRTVLEPSYLYKIFQNDSGLFADVNETLYSFENLNEILDLNKCRRFLENFKNGKRVTKDFTTDLKLMGSLVTFCYSYRYLTKGC